MDKMLRACLNWKVIGALVLVGLGVWAVAPNLLVGVLPILLIAVCPLSMMLMMRGMQGEHGSHHRGADQETRVAPSRDVRLGELMAERRAIDQRIVELEERAEETAAREMPEGDSKVQP